MVATARSKERGERLVLLLDAKTVELTIGQQLFRICRKDACQDRKPAHLHIEKYSCNSERYAEAHDTGIA